MQARPSLLADDPDGLVATLQLAHAPGGSVHGQRANFTGLILGCIDASKQARTASIDASIYFFE